MSRVGYFWITYMTLLFTGITWFFHPSPHLIWNASPSVPEGLYGLSRTGMFRRGEVVALRPPPALARYMAARFYLPLGLPLIKHVGALFGDTVCRRGQVIWINNYPVATAQDRDHLGRPLPVWQGCHSLTADEIFLINPEVDSSFDGRYFGVLPSTSVLGRTVPLFTKSDEPQP